MQKIWHTLLRLIFPPLLYTTIQFITMYLVYHGCALYLGGGPQALAQSAQLLLDYSLPILILSACLTIPLLLWLFSRDVRRRPLAPAPAKGLGVTLFWAAVFGPGLCLSINILLALSPLAQYAAGYQEVSTILYGAALWQQLIGPALIIPLCEELIFRALMFRGLRDELPFWAAALLSSLAFAIYHGNLYQGAYALCVGLCLAWIYERTHVFLAPVILHISANLFSVLFSYPAVNTWLDTHITLFGLMVPVLFVLTIFSLVLIRRRTAET